MDILEQRLFVGSIDGRIYCVDLSMPPQDTDASLVSTGTLLFVFSGLTLLQVE